MKLMMVPVFLCALVFMSATPCSGLTGGLSPDLLKNMSDIDVAGLVADVLARNPLILHKLEPVLFAIGPLMEEVSAPKLRPEIAQIFIPWFLDHVPAWIQNPDLILGVRQLVKNFNKVNMTGLPSPRMNYTQFMNGVMARTDYIQVVEDFLTAESLKITNAIGLDPQLAKHVLPWILENTAMFLRHDGPALLHLVIQELNSVDTTGLDMMDNASAITAILGRVKYARLLSEAYNLPSIQGIFHAGYQIIGLDPGIGDKLFPSLLSELGNVVNITLGQINAINLTALAGLYHHNITDTDLLKSINYLDIIKSMIFPKLGSLVTSYLRDNAVGILKAFTQELNLAHKSNPFFFIFHKETFPNLLQVFDWGEFLKVLLENFGKPVFDLIGLNYRIGKVLAPVIAKDIPQLLKFSINDLNRINVTLVENANGTSPFIVILKELDISNILHEFAKWKGIKYDDIMGIKTGEVLILLDWVSVRAINFLKSEAYGLLEIVVEEIIQVNRTGLDPTDPDSYAGELLKRLPWSEILADIIGDQKDLLMSLLNLDALGDLDTEVLSRVIQPVMSVLPDLLNVFTDSLSDANFTGMRANASVLDILRQINVDTLWRDVVKLILPSEVMFRNVPRHTRKRAAMRSSAMQSPLATCGQDSRDFILNVINETWAMQMLDAAGKPSAGLLRGALHMLGSYDECVAIKADFIGEDSARRSFGGRYCRVAFDLQKSLLLSLVPSLTGQRLYGMQTTITLGVCLPDTCHSHDVVNFFEDGVAAGLNLSPLSVTCNESLDVSDDQNAILVLAIVIALILLMIAATVVHMIKWGHGNSHDKDFDYSYQDSYQAYDNPYPTEDDEADSKATTTTFSNGSTKGEIPDSTHFKIKTDTMPNDEASDDSNYEEKPGLGKRIVMSFSAVRIVGDVMSYRRTANAIDCVHGLRTLSMLWIMLGNTYIYSILPITDSSLSSDLLDTLDIMKRFTFQAVMGAHYGIDTFLMISGCLVTYRLLTKFDKFGKFKWKTLLGVFFNRYIRLTPAYILVMVVFVYWYRYVGSGPSWPESIAVAEKCRTDWWRHILYINNLVGIEGNDAFHQCMTWSWFLAVMMQFYLITPILVLTAVFSYRLAGVVIFLLMVAGITSTGIKEHEYGGDLLSMMEDNGDYWNHIFVAPWCRVGSYCIGMLLALAIMKFKKGRPKRTPLLMAVIGWLCAIVVGVFVVYINYTKYNPDDLGVWNRNMEAAYEALGRPLWSLCVAWVIYACFTGRGGLINNFLSWRGFLPLSRLTFAVYLVHPVWMVFFMYTQRTLLYLNNEFGMAYLFIGHSVASYGLAVAIAVLFEQPFCNLARALFKNK